jgi:hypothetical protein
MVVVSFRQVLWLLLVASLVFRLPIWPLPTSRLDLVPHSESGRRPSGGDVSLPGPVLNRRTHGRPLDEADGKPNKCPVCQLFDGRGELL